ncbi:hypothetical protein [Pseudomonas sp. CGJS7]|uniref:hypothetical protein n=1 Tax=Pseudomonas sp. CGJS7 TaxID=3109348 RepID=UPI0030081A25
MAMLLNGRRTSSYREIRDIPIDAISRLEVLPEEAALAYGYRADQRVVNLVLKPDFRSTAGQLRGTVAGDRGYSGGAADATGLTIDDDARTSINVRAESGSGSGVGIPTERLSPKEGVGADPVAGALSGTRREARAGFTLHRRIDAVGATGNLEVGHSDGRARGDFEQAPAQRSIRKTTQDEVHAGVVLDANAGRWYWSVVANADASRDRIDNDASGRRGGDRARSRLRSGDVDATANGPLFPVAAGEATVAIGAGAKTLRLDSDRHRGGVSSGRSLGRDSGDVSVSFDLPVSRRGSGFASLGNLAFNGNAQVQRLSDFGTLKAIGAGLYWSPVPRLDLIASWTREQAAPTLQQLGEPALETSGVRLLDFTSGQSLTATVVSGGNPHLQADRRNVVKFGANWKPLQDSDFRLRADYVRARLSNPISDLTASAPVFEAAFPERFVRDAGGALIAADFRPVNFASARRDLLRLGFDVSVRLGAEAEEDAPAEDAMPAPMQIANGPQPVRTLFSPSDGGRVWFSLTDTIALTDRATVRDGLTLDYLRGDAVGHSGGRPRHDLEARMGYYDNGRGAVLSTHWRSATRVATAGSGELRFSPYTTLDLRLFANLDQRIGLISKYPWLEGVSIHLEATNLLDARPRVRDRSGLAPLAFPPDSQESAGRAIGIVLRKGGGGIGG